MGIFHWLHLGLVGMFMIMILFLPVYVCLLETKAQGLAVSYAQPYCQAFGFTVRNECETKIERRKWRPTMTSFLRKGGHPTSRRKSNGGHSMCLVILMKHLYPGELVKHISSSESVVVVRRVRWGGQAKEQSHDQCDFDIDVNMARLGLGITNPIPLTVS